MAEPGPPRPLTDEQLELAAPHLCYEVDQVALGTYRTAPWRVNERGEVRVEDGHLGNVILEAFLVHVRVLDDFLGKASPRHEDVLAIDFCPEYTPRAPLTVEDRLDIDRRVAHLTLRRTHDFKWGDRRRLQVAVFKEFGAFLEVLSRHHAERASWIQPRFHEARAFLRRTNTGWPVPLR